MSTNTIKTKLHTYAYLISDAKQKADYEALVQRLREDKDRHFFHVNAGGPTGAVNATGVPVEPHQTVDVELETGFLFNNQWNTSEGSLTEKGYRVFDWYEGIHYNHGNPTAYKAGHWLEITDEMRQIRASTVKCGYCGKMYPAGNQVFCDKCLGSEYLQEKDLFLLRLRPVAVADYSFPPLTDEERAEIMPRYIHAQTVDTSTRAHAKRQKQLADIHAKHEKQATNVENEYRGMLWLHEHNVNMENVIYYTHTQMFCFGWRDKGISPSVKSALLDLLCEFGFEYEIKCSNGENVSTKGK